MATTPNPYFPCETTTGTKNPTGTEQTAIANGICIQGLTVALATVVISYAYLQYTDELGLLTLTGPPILAAVLGMTTIVGMCFTQLGMQDCTKEALDALWSIVKQLWSAIVCFADGLPQPFNWVASILKLAFSISC
jgi:hypothetical protein